MRRLQLLGWIVGTILVCRVAGSTWSIEAQCAVFGACLIVLCMTSALNLSVTRVATELAALRRMAEEARDRTRED